MFGVLAFLSAIVFSSLSVSPAFAEERIEATGEARAPKNAVGAQAKLLARRGAMLDLYRSLLGHGGGRGGIVKGVQLIDERWDGKTYTVRGFVVISEEALIASDVREGSL